MLAVDVVANAIRSNPRDIAAGTLAERYLRALHAAGYVVKTREEFERAIEPVEGLEAHLKRMREG